MAITTVSFPLCTRDSVIQMERHFTTVPAIDGMWTALGHAVDLRQQSCSIADVSRSGANATP
jgi:hypothetical protein